MSGMTTAQSTIAADLDAYEEAMWFTSAYLIAMASFGPLAGRLAAIFSPRAIILATSCFFVVGGLVSSQARSLPVFLLGRVLSGTGGAGMLVLSMILVLELTSKRQRGLFIGLVNSGFTTGVSLGAVLFGALIPVTGWVSSPVLATAVWPARPEADCSSSGSSSGSSHPLAPWLPWGSTLVSPRD